LKTNLLNTALEQLGTSTDLVSTKSALQVICSEFGTVRRLDVLLACQGDTRQSLCFLRMGNSEQEQQVVRFLDIARFSGDLVMVVDLPAQGPTKHVKSRPALRSVANC
jgi:hypothetical protein